MKLSNTPPNLNNLKDLGSLIRTLAPWVQQMSDAINNPQLTITDNLALQIITVVFGAAKASVTTAHKLGIKPTGYIPIGLTKAMTVFNGTGTTNTQQISLQSSAAGTATILIF